VRARPAALLFLALVPASASASPSSPALALRASPAHVALVGAAHQVIRVANRGTEPVVVDAAPAGLTLGLHGAPRILLTGASARRAASWLRIRPARLVLPGGASAELRVTSTPPRVATPGDHAALVLLTTRASARSAVGVRMRIGITVVVRVPGRTRHALVLRGLHLRRVADARVFQLMIANAGNVVESLRRGDVQLQLVAGKRVVARLLSPSRELLPHGTGVVDLPYRGRARGYLTARVAVTPRAGPAFSRTFRLRL
jgi:hypothetical protein